MLLRNLASNEKYNTFLEIGTWNGLGSTKCFIEGFKFRNTPFIFYSLECNCEKSTFARNLYANIENVNILNEVILNTMPSDMYTIFPELAESSTYQYWNYVDFENMKDKPLFLKRSNLPEYSMYYF
jgi:hypothetical protein